jgi:hypothetical protein
MAQRRGYAVEDREQRPESRGRKVEEKKEIRQRVK